MRSAPALLRARSTHCTHPTPHAPLFVLALFANFGARTLARWRGWRRRSPSAWHYLPKPYSRREGCVVCLLRYYCSRSVLVSVYVYVSPAPHSQHSATAACFAVC